MRIIKKYDEINKQQPIINYYIKPTSLILNFIFQKLADLRLLRYLLLKATVKIKEIV